MSRVGENVVPLVGSMLPCMVKRGPDGAGLVADGMIIKSYSIAAMQPVREGQRSQRPDIP